MKRTLIFLLYHPATLSEFRYIKDLDGGKSDYILICCGHPYFNEEILSLCLKEFTQVLCLPEIVYDRNLFKGFNRYFKFKKIFNKNIHPIIEALDGFYVFSDGSAYLPVNVLITRLKRYKNCRGLVYIRDDHTYKKEVDILKTIHALFYTCFLRLHGVYFHKTMFFLYLRESHDKVIRILGPFQKNVLNVANNRFVFRKSLEKRTGNKNVIIIYTDTMIDYDRNISEKEYKEKLEKFFLRMAEHYNGYRIICKPHPMDAGKLMRGTENIEHETYRGVLNTQLFLDEIFEKVKACYSVSSFSCMEASNRGIPSYTLYKYLGFNGDYPKVFFEEWDGGGGPYLHHIESLDEIGIIDNLEIEQDQSGVCSCWNEVLD